MNYILFIFSVLFLVACKPEQPSMRVQESPAATSDSIVPTVTDSPALPSSPTPNPTARQTSTVRPTPNATQSPVTGLEIRSLPSTWKSDYTRNLQAIDTVVIHSLYNPNVPNGLTIQAAKAVLDESEVSSHYVIARDGQVYRLVDENYLAWHAGDSQMPAPDGRKKVNDFSIGIELIATQESGITQSQYEALTLLVSDLANRLPISHIVGHDDIAPGRKTDPWKFDWETFKVSLQKKSSKTFTFY